MQPPPSSTATPALYGTRVTSPREHQVIELVAQGLKNSEVADISVKIAERTYEKRTQALHC